MTTAGLPPRYQIFLSSTYDDLRQERQQATQAVLEMGHFPAGMELFPASDQTQADLIHRVIGESDYYVLILGGRYGSTDLTGRSYSEMEFDWALEHNLPILSFVRRNIEDIASKWSENDPDKKLRLEAFRTKVLSKHVRLFDTAAELGMQVMKSLMNESRINPRVGWLRADQLPVGLDLKTEAELRAEVKESKLEIRRLQRALRDTKRSIPDIADSTLSQASDVFNLHIIFQNKSKQQEARSISLSWDEIFATIAPSMYGYIQRKFISGYDQIGAYGFEIDLITLIRLRNIVDYGTRNIKLVSYEIDTIMIQFQQLGYIRFVEKDPDNEHKDGFRGYTLTELGEIYLTRLKLTTNPL